MMQDGGPAWLHQKTNNPLHENREIPHYKLPQHLLWETEAQQMNHWNKVMKDFVHRCHPA
jgi:hypothetical protein